MGTVTREDPGRDLGLADKALRDGDASFGRVRYSTRARLMKRLTSGTMQLRSPLADESVKDDHGRVCVHCGATEG